MALPVRQQLTYWSIAAVFFVLVLWFLGDVLTPFVLGGAFAYLLDPIADRLERLEKELSDLQEKSDQMTARWQSERDRLEGAVLDWVRERRPRLVHVLDLEAFGPGLLVALEAAEVPTVVTLERVDELCRASSDRGRDALFRQALGSVRRVIVRSTAHPRPRRRKSEPAHERARTVNTLSRQGLCANNRSRIVGTHHPLR